MQKIWLAVDGALPDLSRVTNPKEQIQLLFNYMVELTEQLRYSLQNLSISNWNSTALEELKNTAGDDAVKAVEQLRGQLNRINATLNGYAGQIEVLENAVSELEAAQATERASVQQLQKDSADHEVRLADLETLINGENGISQQLESVQAQLDEILENVQKTQTGVQIGGEGEDIHLVGNVYINGVLFVQGE